MTRHAQSSDLIDLHACPSQRPSITSTFVGGTCSPLAGSYPVRIALGQPPTGTQGTIQKCCDAAHLRAPPAALSASRWPAACLDTPPVGGTSGTPSAILVEKPGIAVESAPRLDRQGALQVGLRQEVQLRLPGLARGSEVRRCSTELWSRDAGLPA